jgi:hypothetical protein
MNTLGWNGCVVPCFLDIGTCWRRVVSFSPGRLHRGEGDPRRETDRTGGWVGPRPNLDDVEEEKLLDLSGTKSFEPSVVQPAGSRHTDCATAAPADFWAPSSRRE